MQLGLGSGWLFYWLGGWLLGYVGWARWLGWSVFGLGRWLGWSVLMVGLVSRMVGLVGLVQYGC